jgi:hypothetical protein
MEMYGIEPRLPRDVRFENVVRSGGESAATVLFHPIRRSEANDLPAKPLKSIRMTRRLSTVVPPPARGTTRSAERPDYIKVAPDLER